MPRIDELKARKAKAEEQFGKGKAKPSDYKLYLKICDELSFLEGLNTLVLTAPESMNPKKFEEHADAVGYFLKRHLFVPQADEFIKLIEKFYMDFNPADVGSYKKSLLRFVAIAIKMYEEHNNLL